MSKSKGITNIEQGILSVEGIKDNEGRNHARQYFDIGHSFFLVQHSLKLQNWTFLVPCSIFFFVSKNI